MTHLENVSKRKRRGQRKKLYPLVSLTSGLTIKLLTHVRNLMLVVVGIVAFHEVLTVQEYVGYSVTLVGLGWYTLERNRPKK